MIKVQQITASGNVYEVGTTFEDKVKAKAYVKQCKAIDKAHKIKQEYKLIEC